MAASVRFANYSLLRSIKGGSNLFDWCLFVDEPPEVVQTIREVEYTLHPTFPDPIRVVTDQASRFALYSSGWGEFVVQIQVRFDDGRELTASHALRLKEDAWPKGAGPPRLDPKEEQSIYEALRGETSRWKKIDTVVSRSGLPEGSVRKVLEDLAAKGVVRKSPVTSIDNKELWGAVEIVGAEPRLGSSDEEKASS